MAKVPKKATKAQADVVKARKETSKPQPQDRKVRVVRGKGKGPTGVQKLSSPTSKAANRYALKEPPKVTKKAAKVVKDRLEKSAVKRAGKAAIGTAVKGAGTLLGLAMIAEELDPQFYENLRSARQVVLDTDGVITPDRVKEEYFNLVGEKPVGPLGRALGDPTGKPITSNTPPSLHETNARSLYLNTDTRLDPGINPGEVKARQRAADLRASNTAEGGLPLPSAGSVEAPASLDRGTPPVGSPSAGQPGVQTRGGFFPIYNKDSSQAQSFREAFANAKGQDFTWEGRRYSGKRA